MRTPALALVAALSTLLLFACGGSSDEGEFASEPLSAELEQLLAEVAELRGLSPPSGLLIGAVPREEVAGFVRSQLTGATGEQYAALTALYRLLGHLPPNQDYLESYLQLLRGAAIGFYSPNDRTIWLVRDTLETDPANLSDLERATLVHEFVHAIQDNAYGFDRLLGQVSIIDDRNLAVNAVLEGDAIVHERLWLESQLSANGLPPTLGGSASGAGVPASVERELRFPYVAGLDWAGAMRADAGQQQVNAVLRERRLLSTAEIMHPTIRQTGWLPAEVQLPDISAAIGAGWSQTSASTLGEFRLANYLQLWLPGLQALGAAQGWAGDRFALYSDGSATLATFRIKFTTPKEAGEFAQAHFRLLQASGAEVEQRASDTLGTHRDGRTVIRLRDTAEDEVIFVIASDRAAAESAAAVLLHP